MTGQVTIDIFKVFVGVIGVFGFSSRIWTLRDRNRNASWSERAANILDALADAVVVAAGLNLIARSITIIPL